MMTWYNLLRMPHYHMLVKFKFRDQIRKKLLSFETNVGWIKKCLGTKLENDI